MGSRRIRALIECFGSAEAVFTAPSSAFDNMGAVKKYFANSSYKSDILMKAERELQFIEQKGIIVVLSDDPRYPYRLKACEDAPHLLYSTSDVDLNKGKFVSIVGTRKCTSYGRDLTYKLVGDLKEMLGDQLTIVSGLAHGIDVASHKAALEHGVRTFGVVAHGLDTIYPAVNRSVAANMLKYGGAVLTEYPTNTQPIAANFLARNRIVAGMCDVLVVAESAAKGGALVTAGIANSYGRSVYAFPGRVGDSASAGCNMLLRTNMAGLIQSADDLVKAEMWNVQKKERQQELFSELNAEQHKIVELLKADTVHVADLSLAMNMNISVLAPLLIDMEMEGIIEGIAGGRYRLVIN